MSETVSYTGKLKLIAKGEEEAIKFAENHLEDKELPSYFDSKLEMLADDNKYEWTGENLYEVITKQNISGDDLFIMKPTGTPGEFDFIVQYYNGGCGFGEALEVAEKSIKID